ncbi:hypothetical protein KC571_00480 [candidate division WWE3 bacterium]|uniref:Uncharacterized protein n=1 Tax=candidate division WWE3 bacterium TaxID=2053526 RepID=A0A955RP37_UNCKA|nr:hypothetical protein [candidate division WWE3 bacterium]
MNQRGNLMLLILAIALGIIFAASYVIFQNRPTSESGVYTFEQTENINQNISDWEIYENPKLNLIFKYPTKLTVNDLHFKTVDNQNVSDPHSIIFYTDEAGGQGPNIEIQAIQFEKSLDEYLTTVRADDLNNWNIFIQDYSGYSDFEQVGIKTEEDTEIANISAKKVYRLNYPNAPFREEIQYLFKIDDVIYIFSAHYSNSSSENNGDYEKMSLDRIVSTIVFE